MPPLSKKRFFMLPVFSVYCLRLQSARTARRGREPLWEGHLFLRREFLENDIFLVSYYNLLELLCGWTTMESERNRRADPAGEKRQVQS